MKENFLSFNKHWMCYLLLAWFLHEQLEVVSVVNEINVKLALK
jgi:hypothetical protein